MKTMIFGTTDTQVTRLCHGARRIAGKSNGGRFTPEARKAGIRMLEDAAAAGCNFIDHADICRRFLHELLDDHRFISISSK